MTTEYPPSQSAHIFGSNVKYWIFNSHQPRTILMIHGFRGTHRGMLDIIEQLPQFRIIVPDLPGFGDSTPMTEQPHSIEGYAQLVRQLMHQLKLSSVTLAGHSMGTAIAAELTVIEPALASHLVLINPIAEHPLKGLGFVKMAPGFVYHWVGGVWLPEKLGQRLLTNKLLFLFGSATMTKTKDKQLRKKIHANHINYMAQFANRKTLLDAFRASANATVTERAHHIKIPTLLIAGKVDAIAPIKGQRKLAQLLDQGTLVELDNVGHIIHYEKPVEAARAMIEFLK